MEEKIVGSGLVPDRQRRCIIGREAEMNSATTITEPFTSCHHGSFSFCHSERSEESDTAQDKLRD